MTGLWNDREASQVCSNTIPNLLPYPSGTHCAWYGSVAPTGFCNCVWSPVTPQFLTYAHPIVLPATTGSILL